MRWRVIGVVSLGVNVLLAAGWVFWPRHSPLGGAGAGGAGWAGGAGGGSRTNLVLRRQFFSWREVESNDYPTYIANLRNIGCPEQTIRDLIIADVNALFARKRATELITPEQQWWRSEPDAEVAQAAAEKARALDEERRTLLTSLLGPSWEAGDLVSLPRPSRQGIILDGPVLGFLPAELKAAIQDVSQRTEERMLGYLETMRQQGKEPDLVELARLRQQTREDLARLLTPPQLEEFLLRYSQEAANLRTQLGQLQFFNATPDEFRAVFRATDAIDQRLQLLADATDANSLLARKNLEDQRENAIKLALGSTRYEEYRLLHDPLYRQAVQTAEEAGTPDAVRALYAINLAAASEQQSIAADTNLNADQKNIALKSLQLDQLKANTVATGGELPPEPSSTPATPPRRTYTVRPGDTLAVVAMIYGVPQSAIRAVNPKVNFNRLQPGDTITLPNSAMTPMAAPGVIPLVPYGPPAPPTP